MIGCTRMYNLNPAVTALWHGLLDAVARRAAVVLEIVPYPAPQPLGPLWKRADMGLVFMCGWPFWRADPRPVVVAAPLPVGAGCDGPAYRTDMIVRADAPFRTLADTFGHRLTWTDEASHSGFNAPRHLLAGLRGDRARLYAETVGPVVTARASLMSVVEGRSDVAPLDSFFHALLRRYEPALAAQVRTVAHTDCAPVPLLVASPGVDQAAVGRLRAVLLGAADDPVLAPMLEPLCLSGFAAVPDPGVYAAGERWAEAAVAGGYPVPA